MDNSTSNSLNKLLEGANIVDVEIAIEKMKRLKEMKDFAIEQFGSEPKHEMKKKGDGFQEQYRYSTRISGKQISFTGKSPEIVYKKVWEYFHSGKATLSRNATLKEVFFEYFEVRQRDQSLSTETFRNELIDWNRFLGNHHIASMPIKNITVTDLKEYFGEITGRGLLKKKAARKPLTILIAVFDFAVPTYCEHNIAREINLNNYHFSMEEDVDIFSDEEVEVLLSYVKSLPQTVFTLAVRLDFCFNMRIGELRALTWDDYNEKEETVKIWHQVVLHKVNGKRTTVDIPYTKGNKESGIRVLRVSPEAKRIFEELRKINGNKHYILHATGNAKFSISTDHFNEHLKRYCEECGINYRSSHKVRYLGITKMYEAGVEEVVIQKSAGHSDPNMTKKYNKDRRSPMVNKEVWNNLFG